MSGTDPVEVSVQFERMNNRQTSVFVEFEGRWIWLPASQITFDGDLPLVEQGEIIDVELPEWLAYEKGLI